VIPSREILDLRAEWSLDPGIIEKDYVLGWLLAGIATQPLLAQSWHVPPEVLLRDVSLLGGPRFHHREQRPRGARGPGTHLPVDS